MNEGIYTVCIVLVPTRSAVNLDSVESVAIGALIDRLGRLSNERMRQLCAALEVAVDCRV
jgi:mRNA interferase MazF